MNKTMEEFTLTCRYENKTHRKTIRAKHNKTWYAKHCFRASYLLENDWKRSHPEMLDQTHRDIEFMDRTGFVDSGCKSPVLGLKHKYTAPYGEWSFNPYCYGGGENICFDHTTVWRNKGDHWPKLILTEPYGFSDDDREKCDDICKESGYRYKAFNPSEKSLWNDGCYMIFWWHSDFYEPDFNILMPGKNDC
tara:strand:- start:382 stop:957 length:576 start_codon:yes stop_codon:yes gene_type:complete